jgi:hypothetical protein
MSANIASINAAFRTTVDDADRATDVKTFNATFRATHYETIRATNIAANDETFRPTFKPTFITTFLSTNRTAFWSTIIKPDSAIKSTFDTTKLSAIKKPYIATDNETIFTALVSTINGTDRATFLFTIWSTNIKSHTAVFHTNIRPINCADYGSSGCTNFCAYKSSHKSIFATHNAAYNSAYI